MYKHLYAKRKVSIRTPFVMKQRKDWVTDRSASQPSEETSWGFPLVEKRTTLNPLAFSGIAKHILQHYFGNLCHLVVVIPWSNYVCVLILMGLLWEHFQIIIFCMVDACSCPFLSLLHHSVLLLWARWVISHFRYKWVYKRVLSPSAYMCVCLSKLQTEGSTHLMYLTFYHPYYIGGQSLQVD